jgi:two-component sensor histidine kinase
MTLELDLVTSLGIIVAEVTSNAYLHAFHKGPGKISVKLVHKNHTGTLTISDDGSGFIEKPGSKRHGVGLIKRLMEQAKGTAELKSDHGTTWTFSFPLATESPQLSDA